MQQQRFRPTSYTLARFAKKKGISFGYVAMAANYGLAVL
jgi:hypothetical protein